MLRVSLLRRVAFHRPPGRGCRLSISTSEAAEAARARVEARAAAKAALLAEQAAAPKVAKPPSWFGADSYLAKQSKPLFNIGIWALMFSLALQALSSRTGRQAAEKELADAAAARDEARAELEALGAALDALEGAPNDGAFRAAAKKLRVRDVDALKRQVREILDAADVRVNVAAGKAVSADEAAFLALASAAAAPESAPQEQGGGRAMV